MGMKDYMTKHVNSAGKLSAILERQRNGFLRDGPPSLKQRRGDLAWLELAIKASAERTAEAITADFGSRSRQESLLAEVLVVCSSIRHALWHLPKWLRPKRVGVSHEFTPAPARILCQPVGVVGIISPWATPFSWR